MLEFVSRSSNFFQVCFENLVRILLCNRQNYLSQLFNLKLWSHWILVFELIISISGRYLLCRSCKRPHFDRELFASIAELLIACGFMVPFVLLPITFLCEFLLSFYFVKIWRNISIMQLQVVNSLNSSVRIHCVIKNCFLLHDSTCFSCMVPFVLKHHR